MRKQSFFLLPHWVIAVSIQLATMIVPIIALDNLHANAAQLGMLAALGRIPPVFLALGFGTLADRTNKKWLLLGGTAGSVACTAMIALALNMDWISFCVLLTAALVGGAFSCLYDTAFAAAIPSQVLRRARFAED